MKTGINIKYENPQQVGADRIVNAVAGYEKYGGPLILIDFGTATTFCAVSQKGEYLGGAISPGIKISSEALFQRASKLHKVEIAKPEKVIGKKMLDKARYHFCSICELLLQCISSKSSHSEVRR